DGVLFGCCKLCELLSEQTRSVSRLQLLDRQAGGFLGLRGGPANITALEASGLEQCIAHLIGFLRTLLRGLCATENLSLDFPSRRLGLANIFSRTWASFMKRAPKLTRSGCQSKQRGF